MQQNEQPTPLKLRSLTAERFRTEQLNGWAASVPFNQRRLRLLAGLVVVGVFGFGGYWASTAELGGAAVGSGRVIATGSNRIVQHLEGGILSRILVRQGDVVAAGTPLAELDTTAVKSQLSTTQIQRATLAIQLARWRAAIDGADSFTVDPKVLEPMQDNQRVVAALKSEQGAFAALLAVERKQLSMIDAKIEASDNEIAAQQANILAFEQQDQLIKLEHSDLNKLLTSGLTGKSRVLALERTIAQIDAQRATAQFSIAKARSDIKALNEEKEQTSLRYAEEANRNFATVQRDMNTTEDIEARLQDRLTRAVIRSPADGVVFRVYKQTEGAVLTPGEAFVEIFPDREAMSVEVIVQPKDITSIHKGQTVDIVFQSDHNAKLLPVEGTVDYISTDSIVNDSGRALYMVRASVNRGQDERRVLPGNTADVYFQTEPKTLVQILAEPLTRFAFKAFTG
jgi:HlyD family type I secretion membrane fusion protein